MYSCSCLTPVRAAELLDHILEFVVTGFILPTLTSPVSRSVSNVHAEHHYLRSHGGHLIAEAVLVDAVHVRCESVLPVGLPLPGMYGLSVRSHNPHVNVEEASLRHLEHEPHLGARLDLVEETLLRVSVHGDEEGVDLGDGRHQQKQKHARTQTHLPRT